MAKNLNNFESCLRMDQPNQPVATFIQEAHNLYVWCQDDAPKLNAVGISNEMLAELPQRIEACIEAHTKWNKYRNTKSEAEKQWKLLAPQAIKLRADLLHAMRYAFRKNPELQVSLSAISKGAGYADLIQDLSDLAVLGKNNKELLLKISFNLTLLETATVKSKELAELWASAKAEKDGQHTVHKQNRNKAFWHLHELVTEIREAGRYVFRNDESRYIGYTSNYWKKKYKNRTKIGKRKSINT